MGTFLQMQDVGYKMKDKNSQMKKSFQRLQALCCLCIREREREREKEREREGCKRLWDENEIVVREEEFVVATRV